MRARKSASCTMAQYWEKSTSKRTKSLVISANILAYQMCSSFLLVPCLGEPPPQPALRETSLPACALLTLEIAKHRGPR
jgi:hypothetical protein